jgi:flagellar motor switch protein FliG
VDILAEILRFTDAATTRRIMRSLQQDIPRVAAELKQRIFTFDDLEFADAKGLQRLLKVVTLRDLALALKGVPEAVLGHIAHLMSRHALEDLRDEIAVLDMSSARDVEAARDRIMEIARRLMERNELYFNRNNEEWVP